MNGSDVRAAAAVCEAALAGADGRDWSTVSVPGLDFTVAGVVAHAVEGPLWYALDLAAGRRRLDVIKPTVEATSTPADLLAAMRVAATVAASVIDAAPPEARGFHPFGWADPAGFAAMSCDELLIHTDDACRGLGLTFEPPPGLPSAVLRRLFPWWNLGEGEEPWAVLRWANGRINVPGRPPPPTRWLWWSSPLDEWAGHRPETPPDLQ